jgi:hypothetical protein
MSTFMSRGWRGNGLPQNDILPKMKPMRIAQLTHRSERNLLAQIGLLSKRIEMLFGRLTRR